MHHFFVEKRREYLIDCLDSVHRRTEDTAENSKKVGIAWLERPTLLLRRGLVLQICHCAVVECGIEPATTYTKLHSVTSQHPLIPATLLQFLSVYEALCRLMDLISF